MKVKNVRFCANVSLPDETVDAPTKHLTERFMWHWAMVTLTNTDNNHFKEIFKTILMDHATSWLHEEGDMTEMVDTVTNVSF